MLDKWAERDQLDPHRIISMDMSGAHPPCQVPGHLPAVPDACYPNTPAALPGTVPSLGISTRRLPNFTQRMPIDLARTALRRSRSRDGSMFGL